MPVKFHDIINSKGWFFLKKAYSRIKEIKVENFNSKKNPTIYNIIITQKTNIQQRRIIKESPLAPL